jgi:hypothetical protein
VQDEQARVWRPGAGGVLLPSPCRLPHGYNSRHPTNTISNGVLHHAFTPFIRVTGATAFVAFFSVIGGPGLSVPVRAIHLGGGAGLFLLARSDDGPVSSVIA